LGRGQKSVGGRRWAVGRTEDREQGTQDRGTAPRGVLIGEW
jgi:hypothetical protein